jgi:large subunit ribosomal protein L27
MSKKKAAASKARQGSRVIGKRQGFKLFGGQLAKPGAIIIRQRGKSFHPGENVGIGRDFTLYSLIEGIVTITHKDRKRKFVSVVDASKSKKS